MKTSKAGIDLIKQFESLELRAYLCPVGIPTIGYGHTKNIKLGMVITEQQAEDLLKEDLSEAEKSVNSQSLSINQYQFDALVSFVFNVGIGNFRNSTLLKKVKLNPEDKSISDEFAKWKYGTVKGRKVVLAGLVKRRRYEAELYFKR